MATGSLIASSATDKTDITPNQKWKDLRSLLLWMNLFLSEKLIFEFIDNQILESNS